MRSIRIAGILASVSVTLLLLGCGDTYRPVVNPEVPPGGNPEYSNTAFVVNQGLPETSVSATCANPPCPTAGTIAQIDVPGDVDMAEIDVGRTPWMSFISGATLWIPNLGDNSVSFYVPSNTGPTYPTGPNVTTVSLPVSANPIAVAGNGTYIYVAFSGLNQIGVITGASMVVTQTINLKQQPVAMTQTPDGKYVYVISKGTGTTPGTATAIAMLDNRVLNDSIPLGINPVAAVATSDYVFVLNRESGGPGSVTVISTANNQVMGTLPVGRSSDSGNWPLTNPIYLEKTKARIFVANSDDDTVSMYELSKLGTGTLPTRPDATFTLAQGARPVSVAALTDGTRVYTADQGTGNVSVIDIGSGVVKDVPAGAVVQNANVLSPVKGTNTIAVAVSNDGKKVYAINHDRTAGATGETLLEPGTAVLNTQGVAGQSAADQVVAYVPAPFQDPLNCMVSSWVASTTYNAGARVTPTIISQNPADRLIFVAQNAGTSAATEPAWCTSVGCTVTDNTGSNAITWVGTTPPSAASCPRKNPSYLFVQY